MQEGVGVNAGTLFSGIGAPECSAPGIDWRWCAEIDPFASAVHAARFPDILNLGDVMEINADAIEPVDLVVFGSPCQSFSVAGKRLGLEDPRGNLALVALYLVERLRPRWFVFENVPGLLSSDGGRDFGAFLGTVEQCGYGWAYRTLDAQFAGVPQRRRRVFVVGCLGDWRAAAAVLFEPESLRGDTPPRREAGQRIARPVAGCLEGGSGYRNDADAADNLIAFSAKDHGGDAGETAPTLRAGTHHKSHANAGVMPAVAYGLDCENLGDGGNVGWHPAERPSITLNTNGNIGVAYGLPSDAPRSGVAKTPSADAEGRVRLRDPGFNVMVDAIPIIDGGAAHIVAHSLRADGFDASEDGIGRGTPLTLAIRGRGDSHDLEYRQDGTANAVLTPNGGRAGIGVGAVAVENNHGRMDDRALARAANLPAGSMRQVWSAEGGSPPQERRLERSATGEFGAPLPQLSHQGAPSSDAMRNLRQPAKGTRPLQQASSPHETVGRPQDGEGQPEYARLSVRRLTPRECERLQGFPDDFTAISYRGKPAADGPRYRALGNSMAVPVIGWVLGRIHQFEGGV
jgi:DNA (cytosine-5)-methyltransferase 1